MTTRIYSQISRGVASGNISTQVKPVLAASVAGLAYQGDGVELQSETGARYAWNGTAYVLVGSGGGGGGGSVSTASITDAGATGRTLVQAASAAAAKTTLAIVATDVTNSTATGQALMTAASAAAAKTTLAIASTDVSGLASSATVDTTNASNITTGTIAAARLPASVVGGMVYQGTWNATTNTPTLVSGTGTKGFLYKVSVAGTTALDGISTWNVNDSVVFDGTTWDKIDGISSEVVTVAGRSGVVTLASTDLTDSTATGRSLLTAASAAAAKTTLAIVAADVSNSTATGQALMTAASAAAAKTTLAIAATDISNSTATGQALMTAANAAAAKTTLAIVATDVTNSTATGQALMTAASAAAAKTTLAIVATDVTNSTATGQALMTAASAAAAKTTLALTASDVAGVAVYPATIPQDASYYSPLAASLYFTANATAITTSPLVIQLVGSDATVLGTFSLDTINTPQLSSAITALPAGVHASVLSGAGTFTVTAKVTRT